MKLCMYVGYLDANKVSNIGGDPEAQLHLIKRFTNVTCDFLVVSQSAGGITIFRKPYVRTVCNVTQ